MATKSERRTSKEAEVIFRQAKEAWKNVEYEKALTLFEKAAEMGYVPAYVEIGKIYEGFAVSSPSAWKKALKWIRRGVQAGEPEAMNFYSHMYYMYYGGDAYEMHSAQKGFYWLRRAYKARLKNGENPSKELWSLGDKYIHGEGVKKDIPKGIALLEEAASLGNATAMGALGDMYRYGNDVMGINLQKALNWYIAASEVDKTNGRVMSNIASIYALGGTGVEKDIDKAVAWYEIMFFLPDTKLEQEAIEQLILIYAEKQDVEWEQYWKGRKKELIPHWKKAEREELEKTERLQFAVKMKLAEDGDLMAMEHIAKAFQQGTGVKKDIEKTIEWFEKAEDWYELAAMYQKGDSVERDLEKAAMYYERLAEKHKASCYAEIACRLRAGDDCLAKNSILRLEEDAMDGAAWYRKAQLAWICHDRKKVPFLYKRAAQMGYIPAFVELGRIYSAPWKDVDYDEAIYWLQRGADAGDSDAVFELSRIYNSDDYLDGRDSLKAFQLLQKSAEMGCPQAMDELAMTYCGLPNRNGGLLKDLNKAVMWYERLAALTRTGTDKRMPLFAMFRLGRLYEEGDGVKKNIPKAIEWYEKEFAAGNKDALWRIIEIYEKGKDVKKDEKKVVELYQRLADAGDADAMYWLGKMYERGILDDKGEEKAFQWYMKFANTKHHSSDACKKLMERCLKKHCPLQADYWRRRSEDHIRIPHRLQTSTFEMDIYKATEMRDTEAMLRLGNTYMHGKNDVKQDKEQGVAWYRKAAEAKNAEAIKRLGRCYEKGNGVKRSLKKAVEFYQEAAGFGNGEAMYHLGAICENAEYGNVNHQEAMEWYRKAAETGEARSIIILGENADMEGDKESAIQWYRKVAEWGNKEAVHALARIYHVDGKMEIETVMKKLKFLLAVAKGSFRYDMYTDMEDCLIDQYGKFLLDNTIERMKEDELASFSKKERKLIKEMMAELDGYIKKERG